MKGEYMCQDKENFKTYNKREPDSQYKPLVVKACNNWKCMCHKHGGCTQFAIRNCSETFRVAKDATNSMLYLFEKFAQNELTAYDVTKTITEFANKYGMYLV